MTTQNYVDRINTASDKDAVNTISYQAARDKDISGKEYIALVKIIAQRKKILLNQK